VSDVAVDGDGERRRLYLGPAAGENGVPWEGRLGGMPKVEGAFAMIQVMSLSVLDVVQILKGWQKLRGKGKQLVKVVLHQIVLSKAIL
jgi:hypothetical protein